MHVREVMSGPAVVVTPGTSVKQAATVLDEHGFTCLPVVDGDGALVGVVSEADLLADRFPPDPRIPVGERPVRTAAVVVADVMSRDVLATAPEQEVASLLAVLGTSGHRAVPVVEAQRVVGVVTYRDLLHALARDDALIAADVRRRLALHDRPDRWAIRVVDGEVTLADGRADVAERSIVTRLAESVIGVTGCRFTD